MERIYDENVYSVQRYSPKQSNLGICVQGSESRDLSILTKIKDAHLRWVRLDAFWYYTERQEGLYDWADLDAAISMISGLGLSPLLVVHTTPKWAQPAGSDVVTYGAIGEKAISGYAKFCSELAKRYGQDVGAYEIWNEANLSMFWKPAPNVSDYLKAASRAARAIRNVNPNAIVISQGLGGYGADPDININDWLAQFYSLNGARWFDAIGVHHYSQTGEIWAVDRVLNAMQNANDFRPIWLTEAGAPTSAAGSEYAGGWSVSEEQQSIVISKMASEFFRKTNGVITFFSWSDNHNLADNDREAHFGIGVTKTGSFKNAYAELKTQALSAAFSDIDRQ